MVNEVITGKGKVTKFGDSLYLLVNSETRKRLDIQPDSEVGFKLWNVVKREISCPKCKYRFIVGNDNDGHDCPNCTNEFISADIIDDVSKGRTESEDSQQLKGGEE